MAAARVRATMDDDEAQLLRLRSRATTGGCERDKRGDGDKEREDSLPSGYLGSH